MSSLLSLEKTPMQAYLDTCTIKRDGSVWSKKLNRPMKGHITNMGYHAVALSVKGIRRQFTVHRLVALKFIPNPKNHPQVHHLDGIKTNNNVENLQWGTASENGIHHWKQGYRQSRAQRAHSIKTVNAAAKRKRKFSMKTIKDMRTQHSTGMIKQVELAKIYGVDPRFIGKIIRNEKYKETS